MKQQRLITHVTGRGDELDPSLMGGGEVGGREGGRMVPGATLLTRLQTSACVFEC